MIYLKEIYDQNNPIASHQELALATPAFFFSLDCLLDARTWIHRISCAFIKFSYQDIFIFKLI